MNELTEVFFIVTGHAGPFEEAYLGLACGVRMKINLDFRAAATTPCCGFSATTRPAKIANQDSYLSWEKPSLRTCDSCGITIETGGMAWPFEPVVLDQAVLEATLEPYYEPLTAAVLASSLLEDLHVLVDLMQEASGKTDYTVRCSRVMQTLEDRETQVFNDFARLTGFAGVDSHAV